MYQLGDCFRKDASMVSREILGEVILVPIRQNVGDLESIYTLNEVAACAWSLLDGEHTLEQIVGQIVGEYDVEREEAQQDLFDLLEQLEEIGAVTKI